MDRYVRLNADCPDGRTCPAVHVKIGQRTFAMQGRLMSDEESAQFALGPGEVIVELPISVVEEAIDAYRSSTG